MPRLEVLTRSLTLALCVVLAPAACDGDDGPESMQPSGLGDGGLIVDLDEPLDAGVLPYDCAIGIAESEGDPHYRALEARGEIPIGGVGQAGLTARMALRCTPGADEDAGTPQPLEEADAELILTNGYTGVVAPRNPEPTRVGLSCGADDTCELAPIAIEISHLAKLPELEGLPVRADLRVLSTSGELLGRARTHGVLGPGSR